MRAKVLTLRFSPQLGRFDDAPLVALQHKVVLEHVREHLAQVGDETMLLCVATWRERSAAGEPPPDAPATAAPSTSREPAPTPRGPATPVGELRADFTDEQRTVFDRLRAWRRATAHEQGAPPYVILTNRQRVELALQRPGNRAQLGQARPRIARRTSELADEIRAVFAPCDPQLVWSNRTTACSSSSSPIPSTPARC